VVLSESQQSPSCGQSTRSSPQEGEDVGELEGVAVGEGDGDAVGGAMDGASVGDCEGSVVGNEVGDNESSQIIPQHDVPQFSNKNASRAAIA
jgi:hypothetical protein